MSSRVQRVQSWDHFTYDELKCSHCGEIDMDPRFMSKIEAIRLELGFPMIVSSAYRCPAHNMNVSLTGANGPHTTGQAIDIRIYGYRAFELERVAYLLGMTGLGRSQKGPQGRRFIHLDDLDHTPGRPRPWVWSY